MGIKVMKSIYPKNQVDMNEWFSTFKVSSRNKEISVSSDRIYEIHQNYDTKKLSNLLKKLKI